MVNILEEVTEYNINTYLKNQINLIADKIKAKMPVTKNDINRLIALFGRLALYIRRYKDYGAIRSFCAGIGEAFKRINELENNLFQQKTLIPIRNIKVIISDIMSTRSNEEMKKKCLEEGWGLTARDIAENLRMLLTQIQAALKSYEVPRLRAA